MKLCVNLQGVNPLHNIDGAALWVRILQQQEYGDPIQRRVKVPYKSGLQEFNLPGFAPDRPCLVDVWRAEWVAGFGTIPKPTMTIVYVHEGLATQ